MNPALSILSSNLPLPDHFHNSNPYAAVHPEVLREWAPNRQAVPRQTDFEVDSFDMCDYSIDKLRDLYEVYRDNFPQCREPNDTEINRRALDLKNRFYMHEGYRKYRNPKDDETGKISLDTKIAEKKWPDEMEFAFFKGIRAP
jgi:hypothetical protein